MSDNDYEMSDNEEEDPNLYYQINYFDDNEFNGNQNEEKEEQDMDKIKEHDIENLTDKLIENAHKSGLSRENAFVKVCEKITNLQTFSIDDANRWFSGWEGTSLDPKYLILFQKVSDYYFSKTNSFVIGSPFDGFPKFIPGSSRYEIDIKFDGPIELSVFDHFHGQKRTFTLVSKNPVFYSTNYDPTLYPMDLHRNRMNSISPLIIYTFHLIDSHRVLIYNSQTVSLVELDWEKEEFWISSQKIYRTFREVHFLSDLQDLSKFALFSTEGCHVEDSDAENFMAPFVQFGQISSDNELEIKEQERILIRSRVFFCPKLDGNVMTVFKSILQGGELKLHACDLIGEDFVRKFSFNGTQNVELGDFKSTKFAWFKNECFVSLKNKRSKDCLYLFDTLTQMCKMIYLNFPVVSTQNCNMNWIDFPIVSSMHFDSDGNLVTKEKDKITFYIVKKPQKLEQIVWCKIRHELVVYKNKNLYNQATKILPKNSKIQPFNV